MQLEHLAQKSATIQEFLLVYYIHATLGVIECYENKPLVYVTVLVKVLSIDSSL